MTVTAGGPIYCIPCSARQVLTIVPLEGCTMTLRANIKQYPKEFHRIFVNYERTEQ